MQEAGGTDTEWRPAVTDVTTPEVTIGSMNPQKDYNFRIRATMENGDLGEPTPPIQYYRTKLAMTRYALQEYKPVEYEAVFINRPYFDVLYKYVPPRMPIEKPDMFLLGTDTVELGWHSAKVPDLIRDSCNLAYTVEVRCPPSFEWRELMSGLKVTHATLPNLNPKVDYVFRVRAWNEYGCSEPTLPVSLYRPHSRHSDDEMSDDEFEREWQLKYGHEAKDMPPEMTGKVPPKLPMDTPSIVTQSPESVWLSWLAARIPAYATQTRITYVVEMREPPTTQWKRDVFGLMDTQYVREGLNPNQEYHFRVRAETEFGVSDPTLPVIIRGKSTGSRPSSRRSSMERDDINDLKMDMSYLENITSGVPPRMASSRPSSSHVGPDRLTLSWSACRVPAYVKTAGATYLIEKREPPSHVWTVLVKDITGTKHEITGLNAERDYMFRVRAKNEFGTSEPTLPLTLFRERDDYVPQRRRSRSGSRDSISVVLGRVGRRSSSIDYGSVRGSGGAASGDSSRRSSVERQPCQPEFLNAPSEDVQYGVLGKKGKITLQTRGYPIPTVHWYLGEEKLDYGDKNNAFVTPNGTITLEIKCVGRESFGKYKCYAENVSGAATRFVTFEMAEPPTVLEIIKDTTAYKNHTTTLSCKVDGFPHPAVKWMKDWRPLSDCARMTMVNTKPEVYELEISNVLESDSGLYACVVENAAGKVTVTGRLSVEIEGYPIIEEMALQSTPIEEKYHVLEEIGRGRYGVVRRVVEIATGREFAANFMAMRNKAQKNFFMTEFGVLRALSRTEGVLRIRDAFETDRSLIFVTELLTEPDLLTKVVAEGNWTEVKVMTLIKKLLAILKELEALNILHLDIKPSNIRMCGPNQDEPKLIGFGLSRLISEEEDITHNYGSLGYASPEQVTNGILLNTSDTWSIGVLVYLLLSGNGPFQGSSEVEILKRMAECDWAINEADFQSFSKEGQEFIRKLLVKDPSARMNVEECLSHPWMETKSETKLNTEKLRQFNNAEQLKRETEKVFTTVQLQSFSKIQHGTKALYQPAVDIESGEIIYPDCDDYGNYLSEDAWYVWQLQYLDDPDSQLFNVQDKSFTVRESVHAGTPKYSRPKKEQRRDQDDIDTGTGVLFRDKIQPTSFQIGEDVTLACTLTWDRKGDIPIVTWYRDEILLSEAYRAEERFNEETGVASLTVISARDYDAATYKCVARTKQGRVSCQARLLVGDAPGKPGCPMVTSVSGSEVFLTWTPPATDGNSYILGYRVDYRKDAETRWTHGPYVMEEYSLLTGLVPESTYMFRVSCHNKYGTGPFSWTSLQTKTLAIDAPKASIAAELQPIMQFTSFDSQQLILPAESRRPSLTVEQEVSLREEDPADSYKIADVLTKGRFGEYKVCANKASGKQCVAKIVVYKKEDHDVITHEFEILRTLRQGNIVAVMDAFVSGDKFYCIYERLSGINIIQFLCLQKTYREDVVAQMVRQILDALQYLQYYRIVHLNLQPSSIVMATRRRPFVKLRDFAHAQTIDEYTPLKVSAVGYPDFIAPEVIKGDSVSHTTDLWTVGALTFTMLSGVSPYGGRNLEETLSRILFDRYDVRDMYDNVTKEGVKFCTFLMRRLPRNRPTIQKCLNSQLLPWLQLSESMMTSRNSRVFKTDRLRVFLAQYLGQRADVNYNVAKVDVETLPKPVTAATYEPILNEKFMNRGKPKLKTKTKPMKKSQVKEAELSEEQDISDLLDEEWDQIDNLKAGIGEREDPKASEPSSGMTEDENTKPKAVTEEETATKKSGPDEGKSTNQNNKTSESIQTKKTQMKATATEQEEQTKDTAGEDNGVQEEVMFKSNSAVAASEPSKSSNKTTDDKSQENRLVISTTKPEKDVSETQEVTSGKIKTDYKDEALGDEKELSFKNEESRKVEDKNLRNKDGSTENAIKKDTNGETVTNKAQELKEAETSDTNKQEVENTQVVCKETEKAQLENPNTFKDDQKEKATEVTDNKSISVNEKGVSEREAKGDTDTTAEQMEEQSEITEEAYKKKTEAWLSDKKDDDTGSKVNQTSYLETTDKKVMEEERKAKSENENNENASKDMENNVDSDGKKTLDSSCPEEKLKPNEKTDASMDKKKSLNVEDDTVKNTADNNEIEHSVNEEENVQENEPVDAMNASETVQKSQSIERLAEEKAKEIEQDALKEIENVVKEKKTSEEPQSQAQSPPAVGKDINAFDKDSKEQLGSDRVEQKEKSSSDVNDDIKHVKAGDDKISNDGNTEPSKDSDICKDGDIESEPRYDSMDTLSRPFNEDIHDQTTNASQTEQPENKTSDNTEKQNANIDNDIGDSESANKTSSDISSLKDATLTEEGNNSIEIDRVDAANAMNVNQDKVSNETNENRAADAGFTNNTSTQDAVEENERENEITAVDGSETKLIQSKKSSTAEISETEKASAAKISASEKPSATDNPASEKQSATENPASEKQSATDISASAKQSATDNPAIEKPSVTDITASENPTEERPSEEQTLVEHESGQDFSSNKQSKSSISDKDETDVAEYSNAATDISADNDMEEFVEAVESTEMLFEESAVQKHKSSHEETCSESTEATGETEKLTFVSSQDSLLDVTEEKTETQTSEVEQLKSVSEENIIESSMSHTETSQTIIESSKETLSSSSENKTTSTSSEVIEENTIVEPFSKTVDGSATTVTNVEERQETRISGSSGMVQAEGSEVILESATESTTVGDIENVLERAKVTESREVIREFTGKNLEKMQKEIQAEGDSEDCGKYLMGDKVVSHTVAEPDEEEISNQVKYMDDALMFC